MKRRAKYHLGICAFALFLIFGVSAKAQHIAFDFYGEGFTFYDDPTIHIEFSDTLSKQSISNFYQALSQRNFQPLIESLSSYKTRYQLDDWLYYQLVRHTAEAISPKKNNYHRYTLYKWFLMAKSGYDARMAIGNGQLIFYVRTDEDITDIPFFMVDKKKYMCLNYHDYGKLFKNDKGYTPVSLTIPEGKNIFSYKVTKVPDFKPEAYYEKQLVFNFRHKVYHFNIRVTDEVSNLFANYPVVDFENYFNIPLSRETYNSLIPVLRQNVKDMPTKKGIDYLMRFTRYAFLYADDEVALGKEKRFSPEQTLLNNESDCDDRAALFFYLVKEIYNLPMIAVIYPTHLTIAVQFDKPVGMTIAYNGKLYSICEPSPQKQNLKIGQVSAALKNIPYEIVYSYRPTAGIN